MRQQVYLGKTQSGIPGLFTNGHLVIRLDREVYKALQRDKLAAQEYAARYGLQYSAKSEYPDPETCEYRPLPYVKEACNGCFHLVYCHYSK
jgi:hypothetical protein